MNIQTERLADHTARFTVEVEEERLEKAKREAAKKLSRRVNIPGFRKGKAPYKILVNYVGEAAILEDAVDVLGNDVYKDVLEQSDIQPYGPAALEDFGIDPQPTFKFVVPLQPTVDLGDYASIRVDYEAPTVEDKEVDEGLKSLQEQHALIEESLQPVAIGNRVTVDVVGEYDAAPEEEAEEPEAESDEAEEAPEEDSEATEESEDITDEVEEADEAKNTRQKFVDQQDLVLILSEDREPVPGFADALVGANIDEEREFEITYPDDKEKYDEMAGRDVTFRVMVKKIETMTLPEMTDDFAAKVTESEDKQLTLLELRMRIREDLQKTADEKVNADYANGVLDQIIEQSTIAYPEVLVTDQIDHLLQHVDSDLRQRGMTLQDYLKITNSSMDDMRGQYRDNAVGIIRRSLVIQELAQAEKVVVTEERLDEEIGNIVAQFGEQAEVFRSIYERGDMRDNLRNDLGNRLLMEHVAEIAKGNVVPGEDTEDIVEETVNDESSSEVDEAAEQGE